MSGRIHHHLCFTLGCQECRHIGNLMIMLVTDTENRPSYEDVIAAMEDRSLVGACPMCGGEALTYWNVSVADWPYLTKGKSAIEEMSVVVRVHKANGRVQCELSGDFTNELIFEKGAEFILSAIGREITGENFKEPRFEKNVWNTTSPEIDACKNFLIRVGYRNDLGQHVLALLSNEQISHELLVPAIRDLFEKSKSQVMSMVHTNNGEFPRR